MSPQSAAKRIHGQVGDSCLQHDALRFGLFSLSCPRLRCVRPTEAMAGHYCAGNRAHGAYRYARSAPSFAAQGREAGEVTPMQIGRRQKCVNVSKVKRRGNDPRDRRTRAMPVFQECDVCAGETFAPARRRRSAYDRLPKAAHAYRLDDVPPRFRRAAFSSFDLSLCYAAGRNALVGILRAMRATDTHQVTLNPGPDRPVCEIIEKSRRSCYRFSTTSRADSSGIHSSPRIAATAACTESMCRIAGFAPGLAVAATRNRPRRPDALFEYLSKELFGSVRDHVNFRPSSRPAGHISMRARMPTHATFPARLAARRRRIDRPRG